MQVNDAIAKMGHGKDRVSCSLKLRKIHIVQQEYNNCIPT